MVFSMQTVQRLREPARCVPAVNGTELTTLSRAKVFHQRLRAKAGELEGQLCPKQRTKLEALAKVQP